MQQSGINHESHERTSYRGLNALYAFFVTFVYFVVYEFLVIELISLCVIRRLQAFAVSAEFEW